MLSSKLLTSTLTLLAIGLAHASKCGPYPGWSATTKQTTSLTTSTLITITTASISTTSETSESEVSSSTTSVAPPEPECTNHVDCRTVDDPVCRITLQCACIDGQCIYQI
ncbi:hypothetical protein CEP54_002157 [Fusarium duplospermum]|uniref:Extracellular membrane protein CFEM domain-containing protein n=1 Tax=Fusarium duplospermum TaxID=1325734 RepID=A0A428QWE3_9HYPO|nr:hypothetical protein CEP54_002157 [Fusarium duplospermum]